MINLSKLIDAYTDAKIDFDKQQNQILCQKLIGKYAICEQHGFKNEYLPDKEEGVITFAEIYEFGDCGDVFIHIRLNNTTSRNNWEYSTDETHNSLFGHKIKIYDRKPNV